MQVLPKIFVFYLLHIVDCRYVEKLVIEKENFTLVEETRITLESDGKFIVNNKIYEKKHFFIHNST